MVTDKITPTLWFDGNAAEAAAFYTSLFPNSQVNGVHRSPSDSPGGRKGSVMTVEFTLVGRSYIALNGGDDFKFNEAVSMTIDCADQDEVDRYWDALIRHGGEPSVCGWLKDRFGLSWQVIPRRLTEMTASPDREAAARAFEAMLKMTKIDIATLERAYAGEMAGVSSR